MNKFKKVDGTNGKQSEFFDIVYEIFEFMGETLELPINKFKNTKNGVFKMGLLAFVVTVILDYYSSFDISSFIRRNYLVGYIYFAIRSVFIFLFAILKFKITYRIANIFYHHHIHVTLHWIEICKTFHLQHSSRLDRSDKYCFLIKPTLTNVGVFLNTNSTQKLKR